MDSKRPVSMLWMMAVVLLFCQTVQAQAPFSLTRGTMNGGFTECKNDNFNLSGTIGQPIIDSVSNNFTLGAGFWYGQSTNPDPTDPTNPTTELQVSVGNVSGSPGGTVTVPISISDAKGVISGKLTLSFDANVLTYKKIEAGPMLSGFSLTPSNPTGRAIASFAGTAAIGSDSGPTSGLLVTVIFDIKSTVTNGTTSPLTLQAVLQDKNGSDMTNTVKAGLLTVGSGLLGDVSNDKKVNGFDASKILQKEAELITLDVGETDRGDVSGRKKTDGYDASLILQFDAELIAKFPRETASKVTVSGIKYISESDVRFGNTRIVSNKNQNVRNLEIPLVLGAGIYGGNLRLSYNSGWYGNPEVKGTVGMLAVANTEKSGIVSVSLARSNATEPEVLTIVLRTKEKTRNSEPASFMLKMSGKFFGKSGWFLGTVEKVLSESQSMSLSVSPNPFNPSTMIRYELAEEGEVRLAIYNLLGQVVRTLVSERQVVGRYVVAWDGKDDAGHSVSSGIYLGRLVTDKLYQSQKLVLLK